MFNCIFSQLYYFGNINTQQLTENQKQKFPNRTVQQHKYTIYNFQK